MLQVRLTVRATSVRSSPRPLERPEAAWSNISHTGGKRPNTANGAGALGSNATGSRNTASGEGALLFNDDGSNNTAVGSSALSEVRNGTDNTAVGAFALKGNFQLQFQNFQNTAVGVSALRDNLEGSRNAGLGAGALQRNRTGSDNTAVGNGALFDNRTGSLNAALGAGALSGNREGSDNTAVGFAALERNATGSQNIAIGSAAGINLERGDRNIYLGHPGAMSESDIIRLGEDRPQTRTFIAGIFGRGQSASSTVVINSNGRLGTMTSSARYKRDIQDLGERSRGVFQLRPVAFRYTQDPEGGVQYGLIAEEVAAVYPELVVRGADGTVEAVQYHGLISLLLNELQHQQRQLAELKTQHERLQLALVQQNAELAARLARLEEATARTATSAGR
jgi:hypothetical protein